MAKTMSRRRMLRFLICLIRLCGEPEAGEQDHVIDNIGLKTKRMTNARIPGESSLNRALRHVCPRIDVARATTPFSRAHMRGVERRLATLSLFLTPRPTRSHSH